MPGELGNEDEQQGVGYYEHRFSPDDNANMLPAGSITDMKKKVPQTSVFKVLRDFSKSKMDGEQGKVIE
jgi:hypothetical protein